MIGTHYMYRSIPAPSTSKRRSRRVDFRHKQDRLSASYAKNTQRKEGRGVPSLYEVRHEPRHPFCFSFLLALPDRRLRFHEWAPHAYTISRPLVAGPFPASWGSWWRIQAFLRSGAPSLSAPRLCAWVSRSSPTPGTLLCSTKPPSPYGLLSFTEHCEMYTRTPGCTFVRCTLPVPKVVQSSSVDRFVIPKALMPSVRDFGQSCSGRPSPGFWPLTTFANIIERFRSRQSSREHQISSKYDRLNAFVSRTLIVRSSQSNSIWACGSWNQIELKNPPRLPRCGCSKARHNRQLVAECSTYTDCRALLKGS